MPVYLVSGKLGSGKSLSTISRIRDALRAGRPVATNLDLHLEHLVRSDNRTARVIRIPDKPCVSDLECLGSGNESYDESKNGLLVLDELASWLNARAFNDRARMPVLNWLLHSRKLGWDVVFITQNIDQIDKQVRVSLVEYLVTCRRLDRLRIPFVGQLLSAMTGGFISGYLPRLHVGVVRYGTEFGAPIAERWVYRGVDLYQAYDTRQIFSDDYDVGTYSVLPPGYWGLERVPGLWERWQAWSRGPARVVEEKPKLRAVQALKGLDPDTAVRAWRDLDAIGAIR